MICGEYRRRDDESSGLTPLLQTLKELEDKGLIFCSRKEEAKTLSSKFNDRGFNTEVLTGDDSQEKRELLSEKLTGNQGTEYLDYIFAVNKEYVVILDFIGNYTNNFMIPIVG